MAKMSFICSFTNLIPVASQQIVFILGTSQIN